MNPEPQVDRGARSPHGSRESRAEQPAGTAAREPRRRLTSADDPLLRRWERIARGGA